MCRTHCIFYLALWSRNSEADFPLMTPKKDIVVGWTTVLERQ